MLPRTLPRTLARPLTRPSLALTARSLSTPRRKTTTGLVGLEVDPDAREKLVRLYNETLRESEALSGQLKQNVQQITKYRLSIVEKKDLSVEQIEREIDGGQIEELVEQAKDELEMVKAVKDMA